MKKLLALIIILSISICSNAQTNVSGGIYTNTTWTLANSPYIITDTVVVFPGVTLTIEPGVEVKFNSGKMLEIRQSNIFAVGTMTDSITFTSNDSIPMPQIYRGINLISSLKSEFSFCNFYYATYGLYSNINTDSITLRNSTFITNFIGALISNGKKILIQECYFGYNSYSAFQGDGSVGSVNIKMENCIVEKNQRGIICGNTTVKNCLIDSNITIGIEVNSYDSVYSNQIKFNGTGIKTFGFGHTFIYKNEIENNDIGIELYDYGVSIYCNKICSNTQYDLMYTNNANVNCIENNYWCSADSLATSAVIFDGYDDPNVGLLDFMPLDTLNCYVTGCNIIINATATNATCDTCHNGHAYANVLNASQPWVATWNTSPLQTGQHATGLASGNYTVCVSDANGCTACQTVFVDSTNCTGFSVNSYATNATCSTCSDGTAWTSVSGGTAPYNYTWYSTPMQFSDTAIGLLNGSYAVCVSDLYSCIACDTVVVSTGNCSAHFNIFPDSIPHHYYGVNMASGIQPLNYSWSWGDSTANDTTAFPSHTYANSGFYTVCLTITDSVGCTDSFCNSFYMMRTNNTMVYLEIRPQIIAGIFEDEQTKVSLFPNPAFETLHLMVPKNKSIGSIKIYDLTGKLHSEYLRQESNTIDVSMLASGIYFLQAEISGKVYNSRFVKE